MALRRGLVATVGLGAGPGADIPSALETSIRQANPDALALISTSLSRRNADEVAGRVRADVAEIVHVTLDDHNSVEDCFRRSVEAVRQLQGLGLAADRIAADYTTGTKAMAAGLVLAGVAMGVDALRYISGQREAGIVIPGLEQIQSGRPARVLGYFQLKTGVELLRELDFARVIQICEDTPDAVLAEVDRKFRDTLRQIATAFQSWDRFQHHEASKAMKEIPDLSGDLGEFCFDAALAGRIHKIGDAIHLKQFSDDLIADLLANAGRRIREGRFDDAAARLYRTTEMLEQRALATHEVDTSALYPATLPEPMQAKVNALLPGAPPHKVGLETGYALLRAFDDPLGMAYEKGWVRNYIGQRNNSILAHGLQPVSLEAAEGFYKEVLTLAERGAPGVRQRVAELQFPWLQGELVQP